MPPAAHHFVSCVSYTAFRAGICRFSHNVFRSVCPGRRFVSRYAAFDTTFRVPCAQGVISTVRNRAFGTTNRVRCAEGTITACQNDAFGTANWVRCASGGIFILSRRICTRPAFRCPPKCESWWVPECESWYPPGFRSARPAHKAAGRRVGGRAAAFRYPLEFASWYPPKFRWARRLTGCANASVPLTHVGCQGVPMPPSPWHGQGCVTAPSP